MAFTKLTSFSKKPSDLPDVPSPSMTPDDIRSMWETPLDELLSNMQDTVDKLNATTSGSSGADNIGATGWTGAANTIQALLNWLKANKTDLTGDHKGTWQGFKPTQTDPGIQGQVDSNTAQLADIVLNAKYPNAPLVGAKLDGTTDDTIALQNLLDSLYNNGGGKLIIDGHAITTAPLIMKLPSSGGNYDEPFIQIIGTKNKGSMLEKTGTTSDPTYGIDATIILVRGSSLVISDGFSGAFFKNIKIRNASTGATTYALYGQKGSRVKGEYSSFETVMDSTNLSSHNRYAVYLNNIWMTSFRDCFFSGDYGFYNVTGTSIQLDNCEAFTNKISYNMGSVYSRMDNLGADSCLGTIYNFVNADVTIGSIGAESTGATTIMSLSSSNVIVDYLYCNQPNTDAGMIINMGNSSVLKMKILKVVMQSTNMGYLCQNGTSSDLLVDHLIMTGTGKFAHSDLSTLSNKGSRVFISPHNTIAEQTMESVFPTKIYADWYLATPTLTLNNITLGLKDPVTTTAGVDVSNLSIAQPNEIFFNGDFSHYKVAGWVREVHSGSQMSQGTNKYIPLILYGATGSRPTIPLTGMPYFDTTLNKPVWYNGTGWVDATGTSV